jgi:hypothetical protein
MQREYPYQYPQNPPFNPQVYLNVNNNNPYNQMKQPYDQQQYLQQQQQYSQYPQQYLYEKSDDEKKSKKSKNTLNGEDLKQVEAGTSKLYDEMIVAFLKTTPYNAETTKKEHENAIEDFRTFLNNRITAEVQGTIDGKLTFMKNYLEYVKKVLECLQEKYKEKHKNFFTSNPALFTRRVNAFFDELSKKKKLPKINDEKDDSSYKKLCEKFTEKIKKEHGAIADGGSRRSRCRHTKKHIKCNKCKTRRRRRLGSLHGRLGSLHGRLGSLHGRLHSLHGRLHSLRNSRK